jgi:predicted DCC family thiol-disulfide oxidoreductase YuxK
MIIATNIPFINHYLFTYHDIQCKYCCVYVDRMSALRGNSSIVPKVTWVGMDIPSTCFNFLFHFLTKANIRNITNQTAESFSLLESIKLQCEKSTTICLFADGKVIQLTYIQKAVGWTVL